MKDIVFYLFLFFAMACKKEKAEEVKPTTIPQPVQETKFSGNWQMDSSGYYQPVLINPVTNLSELQFKGDSLIRHDALSQFSYSQYFRDDFSFTADSLFWLGQKFQYHLTDTTIYLMNGNLIEHFIKK